MQEVAGGADPRALIAEAAAKQLLMLRVGVEQHVTFHHGRQHRHRPITARAAANSAASPSADKCT